MCIDFPVDDDNIALEDPEEFTWTIDPIPIPRVELSTNTTRIMIIDDDRKYKQIFTNRNYITVKLHGIII